MVIPREIPSGADAAFDLIIIGGGIQGSCLALEASRRGRRVLLLERDAFGGATSAKTSRILHGGLRYLQSLDLPRFLASVAERRWFARHFPELVRPLPCLMPLYGQGTRRPAALRAALALNEALSATRNRGVLPSSRIPAGSILTPSATEELFPGVNPEGLRGGALWYDLVMDDSDRVLLEILRWASACGATLLNQMEVDRLRVSAGRAVGVDAVDRENGARMSFSAPRVVNCAGPWSGVVAGRLGSPVSGLFTPALAFNLILDHAPVSKAAVAVSPGAGGHTYFLLPWKGRTLAGTYHAPWTREMEAPTPGEDQVTSMLRDLNRGVRGLRLQRKDVLEVLAGLLPAREAGSAGTSSRDLIVDHRRHGGPEGLYSVVGVKFTTARRLAERVLRVMHAGTGIDLSLRPRTGRPPVSPGVLSTDRSSHNAIGSASSLD